MGTPKLTDMDVTGGIDTAYSPRFPRFRQGEASGGAWWARGVQRCSGLASERTVRSVPSRTGGVLKSFSRVEKKRLWCYGRLRASERLFHRRSMKKMRRYGGGLTCGIWIKVLNSVAFSHSSRAIICRDPNV